MMDEKCATAGMAIRDTLDLVGGKWKLPIIYELSVNSPQRFNELLRNLEGITPRMLSRELKDLEMNQLVSRDIDETVPMTVEYSITEYGQSLCPVIRALYEWGAEHRRRIFEYP